MQQTQNVQRAIAVMTAYVEGGSENPAFANEVATQIVNEPEGVSNLVSGFVLLSNDLMKQVNLVMQRSPDTSVGIPPLTILQTLGESWANREDDR